MDQTFFWGMFFGFVVGAMSAAIFIWIKAGKDRETAESDKAEFKAITIQQGLKDQQLAEAHSENVTARAQILGLSTELARFQEISNSVADLKDQLAGKQQAIETLQQGNSKLNEDVKVAQTQLAAEMKSNAEKLKLDTDWNKRVTETFESLSAKALNANSKEFIMQANPLLEKQKKGANEELESHKKAIDDLVKPLNETLRKIEDDRLGDYKLLTAEIGRLNKFTEAFNNAQSRGKLGEYNLVTIMESAGMIQKTHFDVQTGFGGDDGLLLPDITVKLPGHKTVIIDSKFPFKAYQEAQEAPDEETKNELLQKHAEQVAKHIDSLAKKDYSGQISGSPNFVIMFLPYDAVLNAALQNDHDLYLKAIRKNVLLATPISLIGLIHTITYTWRQESLQENAAQIAELGRKMYKSLLTMSEHFEKLRRNIDGSVKNYNLLVGSFESNVFSNARRFKSLGASDGRDIEVLESIDLSSRQLRDLSAGEIEADVAIVTVEDVT